jgi:ribosomal protein S17E
MDMQNFSSLDCNQTDLSTFMTIFEENFRIFQENSLENSIKLQTWVSHFILNLVKHVHAKFHFSSFYPDGLRHIFDHFEENSRIFQENSKANSKKFQIWVCNFILNLAKHFHAHFSSLDCTQTDLDKFLTIFQEKCKIFLKKI